jgi:hypothetical protein
MGFLGKSGWILGGVILLVVGLILKTGLIQWLLDFLGWVLIIVGAIALVIGIISLFTGKSGSRY